MPSESTNDKRPLKYWEGICASRAVEWYHTEAAFCILLIHSGPTFYPSVYCQRDWNDQESDLTISLPVLFEQANSRGRWTLSDSFVEVWYFPFPPRASQNSAERKTNTIVRERFSTRSSHRH